MIELQIPGYGKLSLRRLLLDYNGTLAKDGALLPGVRERLDRLGKRLEIHVVTADTFGSVAREMEGTSVEIQVLESDDHTAEKREILERLESGNHRPPEPRGTKSSRKRTRRKSKAGFQMPLFQPDLEWLRDEIAALDLDRMTPLAALQTLYALKEQIRKDQRGPSR